MIARKEKSSSRGNENFELRTIIRSQNEKLSPEKEAEFSNLISQKPEFYNLLCSDNVENIINAAHFFSALFSYKKTDPSYINQQMFDKLSNLVFASEDINYQIALMETLKLFLDLSGFQPKTETVEIVLNAIQSISSPFDSHYVALLFSLLIKIVETSEFYLDASFIEKCAFFIGASEELDVIVAKTLKKALYYHFNNDLMTPTIQFVACGTQSPFYSSIIVNLIKMLLICCYQGNYTEYIQQSTDLIMQFSTLWGDDEKINNYLLKLAERLYDNDLLKNFLEHGGFEVIQSTLQSTNDTLLASVLSLLATADYENWIYPFSQEDVLPLIVPIVWQGSMKLKWQAAKFLSCLAQVKPRLFYQSFLEPNEEDSKEDPNPENYARAFSYIIEELGVDDVNNPILEDVFDGLYEIGRVFHIEDNLSAFRETLDYYSISDYVNNFSDSDNEGIVNSSQLFLYTCVQSFFTYDK